MAIKYDIGQHATAYPTLMLASNGGKHIYSVELDKDTDNGQVVAKGAWKGFQYYGVKDSTGVEGVILEQARNGNWYIEITKPGDGLFIYQVPMIEEQFTNRFQKESNFYNPAGEKVRAYEMAVGDVIEVSELGITGTPKDGAKVKITERKFTVVTTTDEEGQGGGE